MTESTPEVIWDKEIDVPEKWIQFVDDNVVASTSIPCHLKFGGFNQTAYMW